MNVGPVQIGGNVVGSAGYYSGSIFASGNLASVKVGGSLMGGTGSPSGAIIANLNIGQVTIGGSAQGALGWWSGSILATGNLLQGVTIGGSLTGGAGDYSGAIINNVNLGQVTIVGNLQGSGGKSSGKVGSLLADVTGVTVGGSVIGGAGSDSGELAAGGTLGPVKIAGNLQGGNATLFTSLSNSGYISGARITSVSITGSVIAGQASSLSTLTNSGAIRATYDIGAITVGGLAGNSTNPVVISARGQQPGTLDGDSTTDLAIASITVGTPRVPGGVSFTNILAGYDPSGTPVNSSAQIGAVTVNGNWTASNLVAGASAGFDTQFGTADDLVIFQTDYVNAISQIGAIVIAGAVSGDSATFGAHYGFVAQLVTSLKVGAKVIPLTPGAHNDHLVPVSGSAVTVNEV